MSTLITLPEIQAAAARIAGTTIRTPIVPLPGTNIHIKCESAQPIGSFKLRGAYNMVSQLSPHQLALGVVTYSSGNHAQGVAYSARALGARAIVVMPANAPQVKIDATRALGAEIVFVGPSSSERKLVAEQLAADHGYAVIPSFDHPHIIAGQATCGLEITEQLPSVDLVLSPVSGGGLLSGTATSVRLAAAAGLCNPAVKVWGCEPALAADAHESFYSRTLVEWPAALTTRTLGDGLRTQALGALNFEYILRYVDGIVTVTEEEMLDAMRILLARTDLIPEPSGAVTIAAALFHAHQLPPAKTIVAILSGGNIEPALLASLQAPLATAL